MRNVEVERTVRYIVAVPDEVAKDDMAVKDYIQDEVDTVMPSTAELWHDWEHTVEWGWKFEGEDD